MPLEFPTPLEILQELRNMTSSASSSLPLKFPLECRQYEEYGSGACAALYWRFSVLITISFCSVWEVFHCWKSTRVYRSLLKDLAESAEREIELERSRKYHGIQIIKWGDGISKIERDQPVAMYSVGHYKEISGLY